MKTILDLNSSEARSYFLEEQNYCTIELPHYFTFQKVLDKVDRALDGKNLKSFFKTKQQDFDKVNYHIISNKDGKYAWRPFQLINPALYVSLVHTITEPTNWELIKNRFKQFSVSDNISCHSLPIYNDKSCKKTVSQVTNWWNSIEQNSLEMTLDFNCIFTTDIQDCYNSIYTHAIPWALHSKEIAKNNRSIDKKYIGNEIDYLLRCMNNGQTNGIPQGSELMNFIAEFVLGYIDLLLFEKLKNLNINEYKILRYRDDYRIFTNNSIDAELIGKSLSEILSEFGFKLNSTKTKLSSDLIVDSLKEDKIFWIINARKTGNIQKWLIQIYLLSLKYPNSGVVDTQLKKFLNHIHHKKDEIKNLEILIGLITEITLKNPRVIPTAIGSISILLSLIDDINGRVIILKKLKNKFNQVPNSLFLTIWFQRLNIENKIKVEYKDKICLKLLDEHEVLWDNEWLSKSLRTLIDTSKIVRKTKLNSSKTKLSNIEIESILSRNIYPT